MPKAKKITFKNLPLVLIILDGWGLTDNEKGNAIRLARTPFMDSLYKKYPHLELGASGQDVGLPSHQAGNSEAGHMNIGAGRVIEQDSVVISKSISNGTFFKNPAFLQAAHQVNEYKSDIHLMGLLSDGSSPHSDDDHILSLLSFFMSMTKQNIYLHLFTDGRDSPKFSALKTLDQYKNIFNSPRVKIATIMGRFYAMDRTKTWARTKLAYEALVLGKGQLVKDGIEAVNQAYNRGTSDEFILPSVVTANGRPVGLINDRDAVVFFNLRSDRARELTKVFVQKDFEAKNKGAFKRVKVPANLLFVALTDFGPDLDSILTAYPGVDILDTLPMALKNLRQLYIAETEKYAHVTYFMNGGYDHSVVGETRINIPSQNVSSYDKVPAMSAREVAQYVLDSLQDKKFDFITVNFANPDMLGHTGNLEAAIECVEILDGLVSKIVGSVLEKKGTAVIIADHGNADEMINLKTGEIMTQHSHNPVPFILVNNNHKYNLASAGKLANVVPTILEIIGAERPNLMTAKSLIKK
jgi:2,3-bisphosphoglycerate-independent phosphoglycerate mutase